MPDHATWHVVNTSADPHTLGQWNSVCTISNGYLGLKGNVAEQRGGHGPVTLIHGVFDELDMLSQIRASGQERPYLDPRYFDAAGRSPAIANLPDPLFVRLFVGERAVSLGRGEVVGFTQSLDLTTGLYRYAFEFRDGAGRATRIEMERFAALRHAHRVFMRYAVTPLDHSANVRIHSGINGDTHSNTTGERQFTVGELWAWPPQRCRLTARTPARAHEVRLGVVNRLRSNAPASDVAGVAEHDAIYTRYVFATPQPGATITLERCVALVSSEDIRHGVIADLEAELDAATAQGFDAALEEQRSAWRELWERCDVQIEGDDPAQLGLRFCLHHLLAAAPRFSDRLSVPVKLLTGEYYQGCTFYDTELYIVPFYTFTLPELARTCLNFRYEGLRPAREVARQLGYDGAKLAWQAGPRGEECLGRWWRSTHANVHINGDVAYALLQYVRATGDERFLAERGIDVLVETARFYAARAVHDPATDRYDLRDVTGPDEGHGESSSDFFTNYLAARSLNWAADQLAHLVTADPPAHATALRRLALKPDEPERWRHVAERLTLLFDPDARLYEQCAGFLQLRPIPPDLLVARRTQLVSVAPFQALNQPAVLMAMVLFRDDFDAAVRRANWNYYKDKSLNFSSMSFASNAISAADVGELDEAYKHFIITTGLDLDEGLTGRRDTYAGLHGTAAGGAWLTAVCGFGGVSLSDHGLRINPNLPPRWTSLRFNLALRGVVVRVSIDRHEVTLAVGKGRRVEIPISVTGQALKLAAGQTYTVRYCE